MCSFRVCLQKDYRQAEKGKIILYTSSMTVVRDTADKCKAIRHILQTHMVRYEERDLFMSCENQKELLERLGASAIKVPQVFADGVHIGVSIVSTAYQGKSTAPILAMPVASGYILTRQGI